MSLFFFQIHFIIFTHPEIILYYQKISIIVCILRRYRIFPWIFRLRHYKTPNTACPGLVLLPIKFLCPIFSCPNSGSANSASRCQSLHQSFKFCIITGIGNCQWLGKVKTQYPYNRLCIYNISVVTDINIKITSGCGIYKIFNIFKP